VKMKQERQQKQSSDADQKQQTFGMNPDKCDYIWNTLVH